MSPLGVLGASPVTTRSRTPRRPRWPVVGRGQSGVSLIEVVIAITVLAVSVIAVSGELTTSSSATGSTQARLLASEIASQAIQEIQSMTPATVAEGIECTSGGATASCTYQASPDPLVYGGSTNPCWYYGNPSKGLLVPTTTSDSTEPPLVPNVPTPVKEDGYTFNVATYPMIDTNTYSSVTCSSLTSDTAPTVPVTVLVSVSWGPSGARQQVSMQTAVYSPPPPGIQSSNTCSTFSAGSGAHLESGLTSASPTTSAPNWGGTIVPGLTQVSIIAIDEGPLAASPAFCVTDVAGNTLQVTGSWLQNLQYTYYGNSSSNPFLSLSASSAVNKSYGGSGPNADSPPAAGTFCKTSFAEPNPPDQLGSPPSSCNVEIKITFELPLNDTDSAGSIVDSLTIGVWDHEQDLDFCTWQVA